MAPSARQTSVRQDDSYPAPHRADEDLLHSAGLKTTSARLRVLALLTDQQRLQTAQDLHDQLRRRGDRTGLTTVYRTLGALADAGLLHVFGEDGERGYRRCTPSPHQHLVCRSCGLVLERDAPALDNWVTQTAAAAGFDVQEHRTEVRGLCRLCHAHNGTLSAGPVTGRPAQGRIGPGVRP